MVAHAPVSRFERVTDAVQASLGVLLVMVMVSLAGSSAVSADPVPTLVKDIDETDADGLGSSPAYLTSIGGVAVFSADDGESGAELWRSDGTTAGTELVADIASGPMGSSPSPGTEGFELVPPGPSTPWSEPWPGRAELRSRPHMTVIDGTAYFVADDGVHGRELWKSDGTPSGTVLVMDIAPDGLGSEPSSLTNVDGLLYFAADDDVHGRELWVSDGTAAGTRMVSDIRPGSWGSMHLGAELVALNGLVYFDANDGVLGREIWRSNGTDAGTTILKDINPGPAESGGTTGGPGLIPTGVGLLRYNLTRVSGKIFMAANDGVHGKELWVSDGTAAGTQLQADLRPGPEGSFRRASSDTESPELTEVDGDLFFSTFGVSGRELWRISGADGETVRLAANLDHKTYDLTDVGGKLLLAANDGSGWEPWTSDGVPAGTRVVKDINPGTGYSYPHDFTDTGGEAIFIAQLPSTGRELWRTDGTPAGTTMISEIAPGAAHSLGWNHAFAVVGDRVVFAADDAVRGSELWSIRVSASSPPDPPASPDSPSSDDPPPSGPAPQPGAPEAPGARAGSADPLPRPPAAPHGGLQGDGGAPSAVRAIRRPVRLGRRAVVERRLVRFAVRCRATQPCAGAVRLFIPARRCRPACGSGRTIARATFFRVAPRRSKRIRMRLTPFGLRLVARRPGGTRVRARAQLLGTTRNATSFVTLM